MTTKHLNTLNGEWTSGDVVGAPHDGHLVVTLFLGFVVHLDN